MKGALDGVADALGVDDKLFRPITIEVSDETVKGGQVRLTLGDSVGNAA